MSYTVICKWPLSLWCCITQIKKYALLRRFDRDATRRRKCGESHSVKGNPSWLPVELSHREQNVTGGADAKQYYYKSDLIHFSWGGLCLDWNSWKSIKYWVNVCWSEGEIMTDLVSNEHNGKNVSRRLMHYYYHHY